MNLHAITRNGSLLLDPNGRPYVCLSREDAEELISRLIVDREKADAFHREGYGPAPRHEPLGELSVMSLAVISVADLEEWLAFKVLQKRNLEAEAEIKKRREGQQ